MLGYPCMATVGEFRILQLMAAVDLAALEFSQSILKGTFRRGSGGAPFNNRRLLNRWLEHRLAETILSFELHRADRALQKMAGIPSLEQALAGADLDGHDPGSVPDFFVGPEFEDALPHLVKATIRRVIQQRDEEGGKRAAWIEHFHAACLVMRPRLIAPGLSFAGLEDLLNRLRERVGFGKISAWKVRRSQRDVGLARLRAWGLSLPGKRHNE
jgi:hypothetical protein